MEFACYSDWKELPESANELFEQAEKDSVFFSRPWFENLAENALDDGQLILACVVENDAFLAILPLMQRNGGYRTLGHVYTSLHTVLIAEDDRQSTLTCLVQGLDRLPVYSLQLAPIAENDSNLQSLQNVMESFGFSCHRHFRFYNWIHRLQGQSFEDYMATRPSRVRNTNARKRRQLEREHDYRVSLYTDTELQQAKADYCAVYDASWKANEIFGRFIDGLANRLAGPGWLRLAILYIDDKPAAAQFWFVVHGKASIFKLAYDETWKQYSPGSILMSYLMRHVIDTDKVEEIDFLTGNDAYKQDWMSERRERWGLYCAKPRPSKRTTERFVDMLKNWAKRLGQPSGDDRLPLN